MAAIFLALYVVGVVAAFCTALMTWEKRRWYLWLLVAVSCLAWPVWVTIAMVVLTFDCNGEAMREL